MKIKWFCIILLSFNFLSTKSQIIPPPEIIADSFFFYFKNYNIEKSLNFIFNTNKYLRQNPEIINNLKAKFDKAMPIIGEFHRYEKYLKKEVPNTFVQLGYLMVFDRQPIKIIFNLYFAKDHWQVQDLKFDDKLDDVIQMLPNKVE